MTDPRRLTPGERVRFYIRRQEVPNVFEILQNEYHHWMIRFQGLPGYALTEESLRGGETLANLVDHILMDTPETREFNVLICDPDELSGICLGTVSGRGITRYLSRVWEWVAEHDFLGWNRGRLARYEYYNYSERSRVVEKGMWGTTLISDQPRLQTDLIKHVMFNIPSELGLDNHD